MDKAENELLTRVGPGTRMGALLRRYWWPVWFSEQVTDKPVPVRILGEDLVLFREPSGPNSGGKLGLIERYCAHRRTSLEFGRVEENGIRCCYHGWKYGADGRCTNLPLEPDGTRLAQEVALKAYALIEASGLVFAYLGPKPVPAFPRWDLLFREAGLTKVGADEEHCNWLQRAENTVDQHHLCSLHAGVYPSMAFKRSQVEWEPAWFGLNITMEVPGRAAKLDQFIFPSSNRFTQARVGVPPSHNLRIRVPTDDTKTTTFWVKAYPSIADQGRLKTEGLKPRQRGVYDRAEDGWWDIPSHEQDRVAQESQGLIADRSQETLGWTDRGVVMFRRMLHDGLKAIDDGRDPLGVLRDERNIIDLSASMDELASLVPA